MKPVLRTFVVYFSTFAAFAGECEDVLARKMDQDVSVSGEAPTLSGRIYTKVLELAKLDEDLFDQAISLKTTGYAQNHERARQLQAATASEFATMGSQALETLLDIALDEGESFRVQRTALRLLRPHTLEHQHILRMLTAAESYFEDVLHEIELSQMDSERFGLKKFKIKGATQADLQSPMNGRFSDTQIAFLNLVSELGRYGQSSVEVRTLLMKVIGIFASLKVDQSALNFVDDTLGKLVCSAMGWRLEGSSQDLQEILFNFFEKNLERSLALYTGIMRAAKDESDLKSISEWMPTWSLLVSKVTKELDAKLDEGWHSGALLTERFLLVKHILFLKRLGKLNHEHMFHPESFLVKLAQNADKRALTQKDWLYVQIYTDILREGDFKEAELFQAWPSYLALVKKLAKEASQSAPYNEATEGANGTIFRALNYSISGLEKAPAHIALEFDFLKTLQDQEHYGYRVSFAARSVLISRN